MQGIATKKKEEEIMPFTSQKSKQRITLDYQLMLALQEKCAKYVMFTGLSPEKEYIFTAHLDSPATIAVAEYHTCKTYAVYSSDELTKDLLSVFEFFLRDVKQHAEPGEQIVVFSQKDYDAVVKYLYGAPINVKLCV